MCISPQISPSMKKLMYAFLIYLENIFEQLWNVHEIDAKKYEK